MRKIRNDKNLSNQPKLARTAPISLLFCKAASRISFNSASSRLIFSLHRNTSPYNYQLEESLEVQF